jgi:hypothetical protein
VGESWPWPPFFRCINITCLVDEEYDEVDLDELYATTSNDKKVSELDLYMSEDLVKVNDNEATFDVCKTNVF